MASDFAEMNYLHLVSFYQAAEIPHMEAWHVALKVRFFTQFAHIIKLQLSLNSFATYLAQFPRISPPFTPSADGCSRRAHAREVVGRHGQHKHLVDLLQPAHHHLPDAPALPPQAASKRNAPAELSAGAGTRQIRPGFNFCLFVRE